MPVGSSSHATTVPLTGEQEAAAGLHSPPLTGGRRASKFATLNDFLTHGEDDDVWPFALLPLEWPEGLSRTPGSNIEAWWPVALEAAIDLPEQRQDENILIEAGYAELNLEAYGEMLATYHIQCRIIAQAAKSLKEGRDLPSAGDRHRS